MNMRTQKWTSKSGRTEAKLTRYEDNVLSVKFSKKRRKAAPTPPTFPGSTGLRRAAMA